MRRQITTVLLAVVLTACGTSPATPDAPSANDSSSDGPFRLELTLASGGWTADEPITGTATLSFDGSGPISVYGSGSVLNFAYAEVGGSRNVDPVWTADCGPHNLGPTTPISKTLDKSGAVSDSEPNAAWLRSFLFARDVRLPAGTWDVTALAIFTEGEWCAGGQHSMSATVRVTITD